MLDLTGTCFIDAVRYGVLVHQPGGANLGELIHVVHAIVAGDGAREFVHAWTEHGGLAWQAANRDGVPVYFSMSVAELRSLLRVRQPRTYTLDEAIEMVRKSGHFGPWKSKLMKVAEMAGPAGSVSGLSRAKVVSVVSFGVQHGIPVLSKQ